MSASWFLWIIQPASWFLSFKMCCTIPSGFSPSRALHKFCFPANECQQKFTVKELEYHLTHDQWYLIIDQTRTDMLSANAFAKYFVDPGTWLPAAAASEVRKLVPGPGILQQPRGSSFDPEPRCSRRPPGFFRARVTQLQPTRTMIKG